MSFRVFESPWSSTSYCLFSTLTTPSCTLEPYHRSRLRVLKPAKLVAKRQFETSSMLHDSDYKVPARSLWEANGLPADYMSRLHLSEHPDPVVDSSFKLGTAAQTVIGLSGLSAAYLHELRTGVQQKVAVDARHAAIEFKSEVFYAINGEPGPRSIWDDLAGVYQTKNDGHVRIHTNFPHHRQGILDLLGCAPSREAITESLKSWNAVDFESEASRRGLVVTALRSFREWDEHPQGRALRSIQPVSIVKVGDAPRKTIIGDYAHPLEGMRVLDLTRVLAGPVCGRTLAAHGAEVLWITSPRLPALPDLDVDTSRGKRTAQLDLNFSTDRMILHSLVQEADVFLQAYRPGGLRDKGFGVEDVVKARPGIVYASLTAYGWEGPWKDRRGFDSLTQTAMGFNVAEAEAFAAHRGHAVVVPLTPKPFPMQALDHAAGYLLAFGIKVALCKTITEGGSWEVRVSLAAVGQWIRSLGRLDPVIAFDTGIPLPSSPSSPEIISLSVPFVQSDGHNSKEDGKRRKTMTAVKHAAMLSQTPVMEVFAPMSLHRDEPRWR